MKINSNTKLLLNGQLVDIPEDIIDNFGEGDQLIGLNSSGNILRIPQEQRHLVSKTIDESIDAFNKLNEIDDDLISKFFDLFAKNLANKEIQKCILQANEQDVKRAEERKRSTTRLILKEEYLKDMITGLEFWRDMKSPRGEVKRSIKHKGWKIDEVVSPYGIVAFIFEGRPNVFADACGVLRSGNTAILRIGSDALETAIAIMNTALKPALLESGLPEQTISLIKSREHAAAWALFSDNRIGLAVARGSGPVVQMLGDIARQHGLQVSLHGTGGAWMVVDKDYDANRLEKAIYHSLDRKVCNTLNTLCVHKNKAEEIISIALKAMKKRGEEIGYGYKIHTTPTAKKFIPKELFKKTLIMKTNEGEVEDYIAAEIHTEELWKEWEWESTPEMSITVIDSIEEAAVLYNEESPNFVVSLISEDKNLHDHFFNIVNSPYIGNGFTRWVDGQYALNTPELGLSNWEYGRLFARSGILSGTSMFTIKLRMKQDDVDVHR